VLHLAMNNEGWFPVEPESHVAVGIDIGFSNDNSVVVTVERLRLPIPVEQGGVGTDLRQRLGPPMLIVRGVVIHPLRTSFAQVIEHAKRVQTVIDREAEILVDCTGQLSFAEAARDAGLSFTQLSITGQAFDSVSFRDGKSLVSKSTLVSQVDAALTAGELIIPDDLLNTDVLVHQLRAFTMGHSPITGQATWSGKRAKDDVVLALSYAVHALRGRTGDRWATQPWGV
jgi:hypothetical protein